MNGAAPEPKYVVSAGKRDQTVFAFCSAASLGWQTNTNILFSTSMPRLSRYQAAIIFGSRALKKMPPMPVTRSIPCSLFRDREEANIERCRRAKCNESTTIFRFQDYPFAP